MLIVLEIISAYRVIVVGGGAAGYFSAIQCAQVLQPHHHEVLLLEASKQVMSKVLISGGGRCNVMHDPRKDAGLIVKGYPRGERELLGPMKKLFGPWDTWNWFDGQDSLKLKIEDDGRVFPTSNQAVTVINALEAAGRSAGLQVHTQSKVSAIHYSNGAFHVECNLDKLGLQSLEADRVIMAGGSNRPGHELMRSLGHTIVPPVPSLFSFCVKEPELNALSGVVGNFARIRLSPPPKASSAAPIDPAASLSSQSPQGLRDGLVQRGPVLITQTGISGPCVLRLSAFAARLMADGKYDCDVEINWLGEMSSEALYAHLLIERKANPSRTLGKFFPRPPLETVLGEYEQAYINSVCSRVDADDPMISRRLWAYFLSKASLDADSKWADVDNNSLAG